jgi:SulP family sulfate permease
VAAATVAMVAVPQCLAYAAMAGLPPAYGLTTAIVPGFVAALVGRSPTVITGPTNTTSLLILGVVLPLTGLGGLTSDALRWVVTLTLLCGLLRFVVAWGGGTVLIRFLPESVLAGFIVGAGLLIAWMQVDESLGLPPVSAADARAEWVGLSAALSNNRPSWLAITVSLTSAFALTVGRQFTPRFPMALTVVAVGSLLAWLFGLDARSGLPLVSDRADLPSGWPPSALPILELGVMSQLLVPAVAIVVLGTLELVVTIRTEDPRADLKREIVAQGVANVAGAFATAFPASASLTRSVLLRMVQPTSRAAAAICALLILPILLFGSGAIGYIPQASLAGVLLVIAFTMVKQPALARIWHASPTSRVLFLVTFASTLVLPVAWAVFVGAGLGLLIHLKRTSAPRVRALTFDGDRLVPVEGGTSPSVVVLEISGAAHYAAIEPLLEQADQQLPRSARLVIVDLSHAHEFRFTALRALEWWATTLKRHGTEMRLAGVVDEVRDVLQGTKSPLEYEMWSPEPGRSALNSYQRALSGGGGHRSPHAG